MAVDGAAIFAFGFEILPVTAGASFADLAVDDGTLPDLCGSRGVGICPGKLARGCGNEAGPVGAEAGEDFCDQMP